MPPSAPLPLPPREAGAVIPVAEVGYYEDWWIQLLKALVIFAVVFQLVPIVLLAERKVLGRFQHRYGPNRVGPFGILQPMADIGKLIFKEQFRPRTSVGWLFTIAPAISMITAIATIAIIPFSNTVDIFGTEVGLYGIDPTIGILYAFAFGAIAFYGLMLGGWASGSKYSFLGAMRGAAQLISYEVAQGLVARRRDHDGRLAVADGDRRGAVGSLRTSSPSSSASSSSWSPSSRRPTGRRSTSRRPTPSWSAATTPSTAAGASPPTSRPSTRTSSWCRPSSRRCSSAAGRSRSGDPPTWVDPIVVIVKMLFFVFFFIWVRATLPRLRYDQLMSLGWKIFLPLATLNALVTAILVVVT